MRRILTVATQIYCLFIVGCIPVIPLPKSSPPNAFEENVKSIDSLYGFTIKEVVDQIGKPQSTTKIKNTTYYVYQWTSEDKYLLAFGGTETLTYHWYCMLLVFDENETLISHEVETGKKSPYDYLPYLDMSYCSRAFPTLNDALVPVHLIKDAGIYCPNADLGHADAQFYIGNLYYKHDMLQRDLIRAYVWYSLAAMGGHGQAAILLKEVKSKLTQGQLSMAQQHLETWEQGQCQKELIEAAHKIKE